MTGPADWPGPWPDVLAAYADGELDAPARAAVERWLAAHPRARAELRAQRDLSPGNWPLWQQVEPPLPSEDTWAAVRALVADAVPPQPTTPAVTREWGWWRRAGVYFGGGLIGFAAACLLLGLVGRLFVPPVRNDPVPVPARIDDPLAEYAVLPLANGSDVDIERVAGGGGGLLPVGAAPLPDVLVLAGAGDIEVEDAEPHPAWPAGGPKITTAPGDAAMIFAAGPR